MKKKNTSLSQLSQNFATLCSSTKFFLVFPTRVCHAAVHSQRMLLSLSERLRERETTTTVIYIKIFAQQELSSCQATTTLCGLYMTLFTFANNNHNQLIYDWAQLGFLLLAKQCHLILTPNDDVASNEQQKVASCRLHFYVQATWRMRNEKLEIFSVHKCCFFYFFLVWVIWYLVSQLYDVCIKAYFDFICNYFYDKQRA